MPNPGVLAAAGLVFFAYLGFEELANLAEEAQDPGRNLPLAILIAVAVSTTLYVLAAVAVTTLMRPADLARSAAPLADAVAVRWPAIGNAIGGIAMVSTANTALISLVAASRLVFSMARGGHAPGILATTLGSARTPVWALAACAASALALAPVEALETLVSVASLLSLLAFVAVDAALVRLRFIAPDQPRPFRTPGAIGRLPLLPVLGMVAALVLIARFPPLIHGIAAVALIAGFVLQRGPRPGSR
jgi:APA family basic amino acid/polyamine antiporter